MAKKRITVTLDEDVADFLLTTRNTSAVVCDAVREYRARQLEKEVEAVDRAIAIQYGLRTEP